MLLYVMRHGVAADPDPAGEAPDAERELTPDGRKKTRKAARGLREIGANFDAIVSSPLVRARQTAEIVAAEFGYSPQQVRLTDALAPGAPFGDLFRDLADEPPTSDILIIGHEPHLSGLISYLLCGDPHRVDVTMKKAAVCGLDLRSLPPAEPATLQFLMQPKQLRAAAEK